MSLLGSSLRDYNEEEQKSLEEQLNSVMDRGVRLYLTHMALESLLSGGGDEESDFGAGIQSGIARQLGIFGGAIPVPKKLQIVQELNRILS